MSLGKIIQPKLLVGLINAKNFSHKAKYNKTRFTLVPKCSSEMYLKTTSRISKVQM